MFKYISHIIISLFLLISTTGFTISKHYCGDNLISVSVFSEVEFCCEVVDCCKNETISIEPIEDFVFSGFRIEFLEIFDFNIIDFKTILTNYEFNFKPNKNYSEIDLFPHKLLSLLSLIQVFRL